MLTLLSSMAPRQFIADAVLMYADSGATQVTSLAAGGVEVIRRVAAGEKIDIVVLAKDAIATLIENGKFSAEGCIDLMASGVAIAVRAGNHRPDVRDEAALKRTVLNAASLSYSTGPSGRYLERVFERWGILPIVRDRIVVPPPGVAVARLIESGQAELGFQQLSELINIPGVDIIGAMPSSIQLLTIFSAAIATGCNDFAGARSFLQFLASPAIDSVRQRNGMSAVLAE